MFLYYYHTLKQSLQIKKVSYLLTCLTLFMLSPSAVANEDSQQSTLTLSKAIERTLAKNPNLKVFKLRHTAINGQQQMQALAPAYQLSFEAENFAGTGELQGFDGAEFTVSLSSVIEMGGKRDARRDLGTHRSAMLAAQRKIVALDLLAQVTLRYIDVITAQENLTLANEATQLTEESLLAVEKRVKAGSTPKAEIKRAMAAVGNARLNASSKQQQLSYSKLALALLWNEGSADFDKVSGDLYQFSADVAFAQLFAKIEQNPALLVYASEERLKSAQLRLAKSQSDTDIQWTLGIKQVQDVGDTALVAGFSIPLFASSNNSGAIISAQAERDEVQAKKANSLLNLHSQLQQAYASRKQAIYTAKNLKNTIIPLLEEALDETQIAYQGGLYSYLDFLAARQELLSARQALIQSASAALRFGVEIEQLIAEPLPASQHFQQQASKFSSNDATPANNSFTQG